MSDTGDRLDHLAAKADALAGRALSEATVRGYRSDWGSFEQWCLDNGLQPAPADPTTVGLHIVDLADSVAAATIARRLAAVSSHHRRAGLPDPTKDAWVQQVHSGIRRTLGTRPTKQAPALGLDDLNAMVDTLPDNPRGGRDRAVLLTAWWSALRSSELVNLERRDVEAVEGGLAILVRRAKNDQLARGRHVALPRLDDPRHCPVDAITRWMTEADVQGHLFPTMDRWGNVGPGAMSTRALHRLISRTAKQAHVPGADRLSPHSTRSGFISACASLASEAEIAAQSGHSSVAVLRGYVRRSDHFDGNAASLLASRLQSSR